MSCEDRGKLNQYVLYGGLGNDPSSQHFLHREKSIRFIMTLGDNFNYVCLTQNFFIQSAKYNDFSGGYKRYYDLIPEEIVRGPMHETITFFLKHHKYPNKHILLLQVQSTFLSEGNNSGDVTGQGIHCDGNDDIMILCTQRYNVCGAENQFFQDLEGKQELTSKLVLEEGDACLLRDNKIFHLVHNAHTTEEQGRRTMILIAGPAEPQMLG